MSVIRSDISKDADISWEEAVVWLRKQPDQASLVRACYYDDPLLEAAIRFRNEEEWSSARLLFPQPHGKALDVGAGRGIASYALSMDGWEVTALEPDPSNIVGAGAIREIAKETGLPITVVEEWGEELPFTDNQFDIIYGRQVLHHARDLIQLCKELHRVLKPGGTFIATREHVVDNSDDLTLFLQDHPLHKLYGGENAYPLDQYLYALSEAGFIVKQVFSPYETPINYFPSSKTEIKNLAGRTIFGPFWFDFFPLPGLVISLISRSLKTPGRLYSFSMIK